jgi:hypothetical protein
MLRATVLGNGRRLVVGGMTPQEFGLAGRFMTLFVAYDDEEVPSYREWVYRILLHRRSCGATSRFDRRTSRNVRKA